MTLDRNVIVKAIVDALEPLEHVHAVWEGGSAAFDRMDEMSDIDLYIDVEDDRMTEVLPIVEEALGSLSPIEHVYYVPLPENSDHTHTFYKLEGTSKSLLVDIAVLKHSSEDKFLVAEIHGEPLFYLNRDGSVKVPHLDKEAFITKLEKRIKQLKDRFVLMDSFFEKEMKRGNLMIALDLYNRVVLASLVEVLQLKHRPVHHDFKVNQLRYDLPKDVYTKLEMLAFVKDKDDLNMKYERIKEWFWKEIGQLTIEDVRKGLGK